MKLGVAVFVAFTFALMSAKPAGGSSVKSNSLHKERRHDVSAHSSNGQAYLNLKMTEPAGINLGKGFFLVDDMKLV